MSLLDCVTFANKIKNCAMATVEDNKPRVRMLGLWFADQSGFYFQAWDFKEIYHQLRGNPSVEICFHSQNKADDFSMLRVRGEVEFVNKRSLKERLWTDRPFLKDLGAEGPNDSRIVIFRIAHGEASFWPVKKEGDYPGSEDIKF
jgi:uncharacterized pyridoxamine 5'-phosphate oxidase family protein